MKEKEFLKVMKELNKNGWAVVKKGSYILKKKLKKKR